MASKFWDILESDFSFEIPKHIKNALELDGYTNALSFQAINDESIAKTEQFVREEMYNYLVRTVVEAMNDFDDSITTNDDDVLITKEQKIDHFGPIYASDPSNFRFQSGEIVLIKEMVKYVKNKLGSKQKNELKLFKTSDSKKAKKSSIKSSQSEPTVEKLTSDLIQGVIDCMELYGAADFFEVELESVIHDETVDVRIKKGVGIHGKVRCEICVAENQKNNKPKSVYYNHSSQWPSWGLSNFKKHLKNAHNLKPNRKRKSKQSQFNATKPQNANESDSEEKLELDGSDVVIVEEEEEEEVCVDVEAESTPIDVNESSEIPMFKQLTDQINTMMPAVLENSDKREDMGFIMNKVMKTLKVAEIPKDGNCLFSALAHQLHGSKILSKDHRARTRHIRKHVVDFILNTKNFPKFLHNLKDRVYETKTKDEIENIETECKLWVKYSLAKTGTWGGTETIYAVAELEQVNVIIFNENGDFYTLRNMKQYDRTICIAYRLQRDSDGEIIPNAVRYHYDSVCDIESSTLYDAAKILVSRQT